MQLGLFVRRALITSVRRGNAFYDRVTAVILVPALVAGCVLFWDQCGWDRTSVAGAAWFGHSAFCLIVLSQALLVTAVVYGQVAPSIASERDRKSLDGLLASRLSAAEIVLGMMMTGLVRCANWLAAALPVVVLVAIVGGIQPPLVMLTAAGLGSCVFAGAALAVAVSVSAPNRSRAISAGSGLLVAWLELPLIVEFLLPRVWPGCPRFLVHALHWLVDSSPAGVGVSEFLPTLVPRPFGPVEALSRMIALQVPVASAMVLWAAWQLRPASRALHDGEGPTPFRWLWSISRRRPRPRRPVGDDPVLWNELHSQGASNLAARIADGLASLVGIGVLALGTSWLRSPPSPSWPSAATARRERDSACRRGTPWLACSSASCSFRPAAAPGQARLEFNIALRQFTALLVMLYVVMVSGTAAMSVILEYERDTWHGLIATSLTGWEILRAKMLAAIWRARGAALTLISLWAVGLLAGAVHPLGFLNAVAGLIAIGAFYAAFGVALVLRIGERRQTNLMIILLILCVLPLSALAILVPGRASVLLGACSSSLRHLVVTVLLRRCLVGGPLGRAPGTWCDEHQTRNDARMVLAACWLATIAHAVGAFFLTRSICQRFDSLVGRPVRSRLRID